MSVLLHCQAGVGVTLSRLHRASLRLVLRTCSLHRQRHKDIVKQSIFAEIACSTGRPTTPSVRLGHWMESTLELEGASASAGGAVY